MSSGYQTQAIMCGCLKENGTHNTLSLDGGTVSEELGSVALLEEVFHWRQALRIQKTHPIHTVHTHILSASCL